MADDPTDPPAPEDPPADPPQDPPADPSADDDSLGDAGKRALDAERRARKAAEKAAKDAADRLAELEAANQTESERAIAAAKAEGRQEALTEANGRLLRAEIKAAAAGRLHNPDDAIALLDLSDFSPGDDGFDSTEISSAIDELLEARPYLAADHKGATPPPGDPDGGPRGSGSPSGQLTRDDLKSMSPEQIEQARQDGRLDQLMGKTPR